MYVVEAEVTGERARPRGTQDSANVLSERTNDANVGINMVWLRAWAAKCREQRILATVRTYGMGTGAYMGCKV